ncbi:TVP38/TMEM64 family protein [Deinococcus arenicola]|uniref:TVP38/TMEM64 family membrane protein n=1 Tax=Deinococcus arenicola TaxID=2994950 RepID=A0ABU4DR71_9DEIO|nr:VTT domain-containing protein [Deinococcus sp. ZS9-10]MDV6374936.1 VTT domain-containing protein [Deinococcus sp. ZS9-10]
MSAAARRPPPHLRLLLMVGTVALLLGLLLIPDVRAFMGRGYGALTASNPEVTHRFVDTLGWAGPVALLVAYVIQAVIPVLPSLVLTAVTVKAYGLVAGFFIVFAGALLGAAAGYGLGRALGEPMIRALAGEKARTRAQEFMNKHGAQGVLLVRLMPVLPAEVLSLVAGAAYMGFRPFMLATAVGVLPVTLLVVWLSESASRLFWGLAIMSLVVGGVAFARWLLARRVGGAEAVPAQEAQPES